MGLGQKMPRLSKMHSRHQEADKKLISVNARASHCRNATLNEYVPDLLARKNGDSFIEPPSDGESFCIRGLYLLRVAQNSPTLYARVLQHPPSFRNYYSPADDCKALNTTCFLRYPRIGVSLVQQNRPTTPSNDFSLNTSSPNDVCSTARWYSRNAPTCPAAQ